MSTATVRLCVAGLLLSTWTIGDAARRDATRQSPAAAPTSPPPPGDADGERTAAARCVDITPDLSPCRRLGYRRMRLPSLVDSTAAAVLRNATAALATTGECGEDGLVLMCSLLAPVCIDRPIWPCASLCRNVTGTCRPAADVVDCDTLPSDDQLCIGGRSSSTDSKDVSRHAPRALMLDARLPRRQRRKKLG